MKKLTAPQQRLLESALRWAEVPGDHGLLVSGLEYRTALALERRGLVSVRYQGPSMGWMTAVV